jgi:DNA-binding NarL/FixJ family response regulator
MGESLGLVLADSQTLFLDALATALRCRGHRVLATTTSCGQLLEEVARHRPDLCVIETAFPDGDGIAAIGEIAHRSPDTKVVVLTADGSEVVMRRALDAGARGFSHKRRGLDVVLRVLEKAAAGEVSSYLNSPVPIAAAGRPNRQVRQLAAFLTPREIECLALLAAGLDTIQIARRLGVSRTTVRSHVQSVLNKLGARTRMEAATLAIRHGLTATEPGDGLHRRWA